MEDSHAIAQTDRCHGQIESYSQVENASSMMQYMLSTEIISQYLLNLHCSDWIMYLNLIDNRISMEFYLHILVISMSVELFLLLLSTKRLIDIHLHASD